VAFCASEPLFAIEQFAAAHDVSVMAHREVAIFKNLAGRISSGGLDGTD